MMQGKPCQAPGCTRLVAKGLSIYCKQHQAKVYAHGSWDGRGLRRHEYKDTRRDVRLFVEVHREHPGIAAAIRWARDWLASATSGTPGTPALEDMQRLARHGTEAVEIIAEAIAVWLAIDSRPWQFKSQVQIIKALGNAVLHLAPRIRRSTWKPRGTSGSSYRPITAGAKREAGSYLLDTLVPLFCNVKLALPVAKKFHERQAEDMRQPFDLDAVGGGSETHT
jgi:hypothetical protein